MNKNVVQIFCKNTKRELSVPIGSSLQEIYKISGEPLEFAPMNAWVNNKVEPLTYRCWRPKDVEFVDYSHPSGMRTYVRSLCHVLAKAVHETFPLATLNIEHPISHGYYCVLRAEEKIESSDILRIKHAMQMTIDADLPFELREERAEVAIEIFKRQGMEDKVRLIESVGMAYVSLYELGGYVNMFYSCLLPSSGNLSVFDLVSYEEGFLLCVPKDRTMTETYDSPPQPKMFEAYKSQLDLLKMINLSNVGDLNLAIRSGNAQRIIQVSEAMQEKRIAQIAEEITQKYQDGVRIILISGPSSSGKTTFCKRLQIQLITNLIHPISISLDDFFLDRELTPKDEHGEYDFESLFALDLDLFNKSLERLLDGEEIDMPTFDFEQGRKVYSGKKLKLSPGSVLVMEGIHALNPTLMEMIDDNLKYKIYVSALTTISLDNHNWIPTTDNRLIRRIIRDFRSRGCSASNTIARWQSVRNGEDKWIFPYQENADATFNSAMLYELAALRPSAEVILTSVKQNQKEHVEADRLLKFLRNFEQIPVDILPYTSLLREFLGGGNLE